MSGMADTYELGDCGLLVVVEVVLWEALPVREIGKFNSCKYIQIFYFIINLMKQNLKYQVILFLPF